MNVLALILTLSVVILFGLWADEKWNARRFALLIGRCYAQAYAWVIQVYNWITQAYAWIKSSIGWKIAYAIFDYTTVCGVVFLAAQVRKAWNNDKDVGGIFWLIALVLYTVAMSAVWLCLAWWLIWAVYQILPYRIW